MAWVSAIFVVLALVRLEPCAHGVKRDPTWSLAEVDSDIEHTPRLPPWTSYFDTMPTLCRKLRVASPCIGIHGSGFAFQEMSVASEYCNVFDLECGYASHLQKFLEATGAELTKLNLGTKAGNLLSAPFTALQLPVDVIIAGPPCPPWSAQGKRAGTKDDRANAFIRVLEWIIYFIRYGGLLMCILENVMGILHSCGGAEPAMDKILRILRMFAPEFLWRVDVLCARDYLLPQTRKRVFLRGLRGTLATAVPAPLPPFGQRHIRDVLGKFPCTPRLSLTMPQQSNVVYYEQIVGTMFAEGKLQKTDIVVVSMDRSPGREYKTMVTINASPTLVTGNRYLFAISVQCVVEGFADEDREVFRFLKETERLALQGFPPTVARELGTRTLAVKAAGNAYPPPLIIAAAHPLLQAIADSTLDLAKWPATSVRLASAGFPQVARLMKARPKMLKSARKPPPRKRKAWSDSDSE